MPTLGNFTFTTNAFTLQQRALAEMQQRDVDFLDGGDDNWTANDQFVSLLNEVETEVYGENPRLGLASTTLTLASGARSGSLPAAVWRSDITKIVYANTDSYEGRVVQMVPRKTAEDFAEYFDDSTATVPDYAYYDPDSNTVTFSQKVAASTDFTVWYRAKPTTFTTGDLSSSEVGEGAVVSAIPDEFIRVPVYLLASRMCFILGEEQRAALLEARYMQALDKMTDALASVSAVERSPTLGHDGSPPTQHGGRRGGLIGMGGRIFSGY